MRALIACVIAALALASTGCWWPLREGGHGRDGDSYGERRGPERHDDHEGRHDMGGEHH